jgi:AsmA protein
MFAGMVFENMELGVNSAGGKLRMNPISAEMFDGRYRGDVQIDASTEVPKLSVDEHIEDVQLAALAKAMYDVDNITGTIKGDFVLNGRGVDTNGIVQTLNGNIALALADGEWQGTDIWYQLRRARALLRQETPPEARVPARTEFSDVSLSGTVANGVMESNDLLAELPFLRLTGRGKASFVDGSVDYRLDARVVEKPEFRGQATEEEIKDFTKVVVSIKVSGQLASPSIQPDIEGLAKQRIEQEIKQETDKLKDRLLDKLFKDKQDKEEDGD